MAGVIGLMVATVGTDPLSGVSRFTYGSPELLGGIPFILVMVGVFAVSELLVQASEPDWSKTGNMQTRMKLPSLKMHKRLLKPNFIGSTIGIFEGCMPGAGGRSEEHTSELQSLMRTSYAVFCLKKKKLIITTP